MNKNKVISIGIISMFLLMGASALSVNGKNTVKSNNNTPPKLDIKATVYQDNGIVARAVGNDDDGDKLTLTIKWGDNSEDSKTGDMDGFIDYSKFHHYESRGTYEVTYELSDGTTTVTDSNQYTSKVKEKNCFNNLALERLFNLAALQKILELFNPVFLK